MEFQDVDQEDSTQRLSKEQQSTASLF